MADPADRLRETTLTGFEQLSGPWREFAENLFERNRGDIERESEDRAKAILENTYGRGLGLSTIASQMQADRERARAEALSKARREAEVSAQQAQLAALGQAAAVAQQEMNRRQQGSQFSTEMDYRNRALNQQGSQQRAGLRQQRSTANTNALATGIAGIGGAGLTLLGKTFQPEISKGIRGMFGLDKPGAGGSGFESLDIPVGSGAEQVSAGAPFTVAPAPTFDLGPQTFDAGYTAPAPATGFDALSQPWSQSYDWDIGSWGNYAAPTGFDYLTRNRDWGWYL